jgi:TRAP-type C4-dicarboxylate transport system permease small subunit
METLLPRLAIAFLGLVVSASTRLTATLYGVPVSVPALWLVALAVVLALAVMLLALLRSVVRDWPRPVTR